MKPNSRNFGCLAPAVIIAIIAVCLASGCATDNNDGKAAPTPPGKTGKLLGAVDNAGTSAAAALAASDEKFVALKAEYDALQKRSSKAAAQVESANIANTNQPPSPATRVVDLETKLALTNLPPQDVAEALKAAQRRADLLEGRVLKAEEGYKAAQTDAEQLKAEKAKLKGETDKATALAEDLRLKAAAAQAALVEAEKKHAAELVKNQAENQAKLDAANAKAAEEIKKAQEANNRLLVWICIGIGSLCILGGIGLLIATSGASAWRSSLAFGCGAICFGLAKLLSHPMFTTYFTVGCVLIVISGLVFLWREHVHTRKQKELVAAKLEQEAALQLQEKTLKHVVKAIEEVREKSPELNATITASLDDHTDPDSTQLEYRRLKMEHA